eukprot:2341284-Pyramimonas_sp.AAC.1
MDTMDILHSNPYYTNHKNNLLNTGTSELRRSCVRGCGPVAERAGALGRVHARRPHAGAAAAAGGGAAA